MIRVYHETKPYWAKRNMMRQRGEQEVESLIESFREECAGLLGMGREEVEGVTMVLRTQ